MDIVESEQLKYKTNRIKNLSLKYLLHYTS